MRKNKETNFRFSKLFFYLGIIVSIIVFIIFFFGKNGFIDLLRLNKQQSNLIQRNIELEKENRSLKKLILRAKTDPKFIENVARQELGMIGQDEIIFKFENN